jgi:hypothetical protein
MQISSRCMNGKEWPSNREVQGFGSWLFVAANLVLRSLRPHHHLKTAKLSVSGHLRCTLELGPCVQMQTVTCHPIRPIKLLYFGLLLGGIKFDPNN